MQTLTIYQIDRSDAAARSARATAEAKAITDRHLLIATRASLGFILLMHGLNGFAHFLPQATAPLLDGPLAALLTGHLVFALEAVIGALLLANRFFYAALALSVPLVASLAFGHLAEHARMSLPIVVLGLEAYLLHTSTKEVLAR